MSVNARKNHPKNLMFVKENNGFLDLKNSSADMANISKDELIQISDFANDATFLNRGDLRSQKYQVEALERQSKRSKHTSRADNGFDEVNLIGEDNEINQPGGSSLDIQAHPELPYTGGKPADQIYFPESVIENGQIPESFLSSSQKEQLQIQKDKKKQKLENLLKLANRLTNKFKFSGPKQAPKMQPKITPRSRPLPKPPTPY